MVAKKDMDRAKKSRQIKKAASESLKSITPQLIMTSVVCVLGIAGIMVLTVYFGITLGVKSIEKETNVSIMTGSSDFEDIKYESEEVSYAAKTNCLEDVGDNDCLLTVYGIKNSNAVIIKSSDQYRRFIDVAHNSVGATVGMTINDDFFRTGNVIAVVKEDKHVASYSLKSVERDGNYKLRVKVQKSELNDNVESSETGHIILIKVPNIQTSDIEIVEQE